MIPDDPRIDPETGILKIEFWGPECRRGIPNRNLGTEIAGRQAARSISHKRKKRGMASDSFKKETK